MALYEYRCNHCKHQFEQITSAADAEKGLCPKCASKDTARLISRFAVGGQGDLRESTMHGCHDCHVGLPGESPADGHAGDHEGHEH